MPGYRSSKSRIVGLLAAGTAVDGPGDGQATVTFTQGALNSGTLSNPAYTITPSAAPTAGQTCNTTTCTVTGLTDGHNYTFTVVEHTTGGDSAASSSSNSVTPAPVPVISNFNPSTPENYGTTQQLSATTTAGTVTFSSSTPSTCTTTSAGLVTPVLQGTCTLNADEAASTTNPPAVSLTKSITIVAVQPGAPTNVVAAAGNASATVAFTPPASNGGAPITGYTATASLGGLHSVGCTSSPCTVSGLINGTQYTFTVTATNSATAGPLTSPPSAASNTIRPGVTPQSITFSNPGTQTFGTTPQLTATASSGLAVTFTSTTAPVCTVTSDGKLTFVTIGTCTINADQSGDATHQSAPTVTQSFTVQKATPTVTVTSNANPSVFGQALTFTATLTNPVATGQLQWVVDGNNVGSPIALSNSGTATYAPSSPLAVGSHTVKAVYAGDTNDNTANGQLTQVVNKASTTTTVQVSGDTITATVAPVSPGAGIPTGSVSFTVGGVSAGSAQLSSGVASLTGSNVGNQQVTAAYSGDGSFLASNGHRVLGPTVVAQVSSAHPKHNGWYRSAVTVSFTCTATTAPLSNGCPGPVTRSHNGAGQSVQRTVTADDGGTTTVTVSPINIDQTPPSLTVRRVGNTVRCRAHDSLSGGATCTVVRHATTSNGVTNVSWKAVATDRAGNRTVKRGRFSY